MVNSVTGPIAADKMGRTYAHEHILFGYVGWQGDLTMCGRFDEEGTIKQLGEMLIPLKEEYGLSTIIDATTNECGRDPKFLKAFSEYTGINIVCSTGYYNEQSGGAHYWKLRALNYDNVTEIHELMLTELTEGIWGTGIKAGVIKVASSAGRITDYEKNLFIAGAKASRDTDTVIITHTEEGTCAAEQIDLLVSEGARPEKIMIGHIGTTEDLDHYKRILDKGVYIAFDRIGLETLFGMLSDKKRIEVVSGLIRDGYGDRILLSHDFIGAKLGRKNERSAALNAIIPNWYWWNIFKVFVPGLREAGVSEKDIDRLLTDNPAKLYG